MRVERGVEVRRQVEVVRRQQRQAGIAGGSDGRHEEAGLTTIVDREVDIGCIEHRNILDPQRDVGGRAEAGGRVQGDVVAFQMPGVLAGLATGVGAVLETDDRGFLALGILRAAADSSLVNDVLGVLDLGLTGIQEDLGTVADHQRAAVAQADVAAQLAAVLQLIQAGFVGLGLHAALAQDDVAGQGGDFLFLLVARGLGRYIGRCLAHRRIVELAGAARLDIGAGAVGARFGELSVGQLIARHPVQMAVVGAARGQRATFAFRDQASCGSLRLRLARGGLFGCGCRGGCTARMHRAWRRVGRDGRGGARPAAGRTGLAGELFIGGRDRNRQGLQCEQAAGYQKGKSLANSGGFDCHLVFDPCLRRAIGRAGPHASRWSEKVAG